MNRVQYSDVILTNHVGIHDSNFVTQTDSFNNRFHFQSQNIVVDKLGHTVFPQIMTDSSKYQLSNLQGFDSLVRCNGIYVNTKSESDITVNSLKEQMKLDFNDKKNNFISSYSNLQDMKILSKNLFKQENDDCLKFSTNICSVMVDKMVPSVNSVSSGCKSKLMVDVGTMTDPLTPEEQERLCQWEGFAALQSGNKVAEYLTGLREFLKILPPSEGRKRQGLGDVRIVTAPDGSRFFCCSECHMAYPDKSALEQHLASHKVERRFICIICGAGLKRKEHLDRHQLSHSDERPYTCDTCPKTFKRNEHLARHYVVHSGEKGQVCGECGKAFYRRDHLQKHAQGHITKRLRLAIQSSDPNNKIVL